MKRVLLKVNGIERQVIAGPEMNLLDFLRDDLRLTGAKEACDRKGQCGACTVVLNGRAVRACLTKVADLDCAEIITVEGLGTPDNPHLIQEAFVLSGAIQCGFCTPGMIMATKALLDRNPNPTTSEIRRALTGLLCRCTGYVKIIEAVKLASRFLRGETTPAQVRPDPNGPKIGVSHPRPTSMVKACGVAQFSADILVPGALEAAPVLSPYAHARILGIDASAAEKMPGVVGVVTAADIKGTNRLKMVLADRPLLASDRVRSIGDPVAAVVAETREQARAAAQAVVVNYEILPVLSCPQEAMAEGAVRIHPEWPNVCYSNRVIKGDAQKALATSAAVVKARFKTQINHQAPLEPEASLAYLEGEGEDAQLVVIGRSINIHKHLSMLQESLGWENMRYEEAFSGGQFGIKIEITTEGIVAAAALKFGRPVRCIPSLAELMALSPKRHAFDIEMQLGADAEGHLTALNMDFVVDNGAYLSIGQNMVNRARLMGAGSYHIPNFRAVGQLVYTNNPYGSAARGAGPPQQHYALECAVDMLAEKMGIDPLEFRARNSLKVGQTRSIGIPVDQWPFPELCETIKPHYERALSQAREKRDGAIVRGVGIGAGAFGIVTPGDSALAAIEMDPDDGVTIYTAAADPGEGTDSMLTQVAAQVMNLPLNKIRLAIRDTDRTTAAGPAAEARLTHLVGGAVEMALEQLKQAIAETGSAGYQGLKREGRPTRYLASKGNVDQTPSDLATGEGPNYDSQVHAIVMAEVEVNTETGDVQVVKMTVASDSGTVIHPQNVEGQLEGGMDQSAGYALREEYVAGQTKDWVTFRFPTIRTAFETEVILQETPRTRGTLGATGVGEMTLVPAAPAIINAIHNACGVWMTELPATRARVKAALAARQ